MRLESKAVEAGVSRVMLPFFKVLPSTTGSNTFELILVWRLSGCKWSSKGILGPPTTGLD